MAKGIYYGIDTEVPVYEKNTILYNTDTLLNQQFTFTGIGTSVNNFTLSTNGIFTSNNAEAYYETSYEDEETGETMYEEEGEDAFMRWTPKTAISNLYFDWKVSSEEQCDILYIYHTGTLLVEASGEQSGTIGPLNLSTTDYLSFSYDKDQSYDNGDDTATISNVRTESEVQTGTEILPLAKKVNNLYIGINNVAKKVIEGYIGINGIAQLFYYGKYTTAIQQPNITITVPARKQAAAASRKDYAFFGGGYDALRGTSNGSITGRNHHPEVRAYDITLTRATPESLYAGRSRLAAAATENYTFFVGGYSDDDHISSSQYASRTIDFYDSSLTHTYNRDATYFGSDLSAASFHNYAIIGTGASPCAYDNNLTFLSSIGTLSIDRADTTVAATRDYIFFAGGSNRATPLNTYATVDAFDNNFVRFISTSLAATKYEMCGISSDKYAMFCGGKTASSGTTTYLKTVDAYSQTLTKTSCATISSSQGMAGTSLENLIFIAGGGLSTASAYSDTTYMYDDQLTQSYLSSLSSARRLLTAASIGKYVLFGGGAKRTYNSTSSSYIDTEVTTVDVYTAE